MDSEDFEYSKSYRKLAAVEDKIQQDSLLELYVMLYKDKYKNEPIFPVDNKQYKFVKELRQQVGDEKARTFLHSYFEIRDDWFSKQHHSLECLLKNINKVALFASKRSDTNKLRGKLKMQFHCDSCWCEFTLICEPDFDYCNKLVRCPECEGANKPLKRVSKEERRKTILKLGMMFPEMPKATNDETEKEERQWADI